MRLLPDVVARKPFVAAAGAVSLAFVALVAGCGHVLCEAPVIGSGMRMREPLQRFAAAADSFADAAGAADVAAVVGGAVLGVEACAEQALGLALDLTGMVAQMEQLECEMAVRCRTHQLTPSPE